MTNLLKEVGVSADKDAVKVLIEKCSAKPLHELVAEGRGKFASMPAAGAPAAAVAATGAPAAAAKKEEKPKEEEPEEDVDMGGLFGDDDY